MIETTISKTGEPAVIIEPAELMIGNILEYKGKLVHVTSLSLDIDDEYQELIGFCECGKDTDEICDWNRALCDGLKPVKLTTNIFTNLNLDWGFQYEQKKDGFSIQANQYIRDEHNEIAFITYIHELQNL